MIGTFKLPVEGGRDPPTVVVMVTTFCCGTTLATGIAWLTG